MLNPIMIFITKMHIPSVWGLLCKSDEPIPVTKIAYYAFW